MKRFILLALLAVMAIALFACTPDAEPLGSATRYSISLTLKDNEVSAKQSVTVKNVYEDGLNLLTFNLYPNAYSKDAVNKAYIEKLTSYGGIKISSVVIGETAASYALSQDGSQMTVTVPELKKGEEIAVDMAYTVTLPECNLRMGVSQTASRLANFYPQLAVYSDGAFRTDAFTTVGDPFFSEAADYEVIITVAKDVVVASSGTLVSETLANDNKILKYSASNIRDFALVADKTFETEIGAFNDIKVTYYHYGDENAADVIKYAGSALSIFGESFGEYPYETLSVVAADIDTDGMEYGTLVYLSTDCLDAENTVVHEIAHQWWYGVVGSDPINEAYLDEALATYSTLYYYKKAYGEEKYAQSLKTIVNSYVLYERVQNMKKTGVDLSINKSIYDFTSYQYEMLVYKKGAMMFAHLYDTMGESKFNQGLAAYTKNNAYQIADTDSLISEMSKQFGSDLGGVINGWLGTQIKTTVFYV